MKENRLEIFGRLVHQYILEDGMSIIDAMRKAEANVPKRLWRQKDQILAQAKFDLLNGRGDLHRQRAAEMFGVPYEDVTPLQREKAKRANFSYAYGGMDFGFGNDHATYYQSARRQGKTWWQEVRKEAFETPNDVFSTEAWNSVKEQLRNRMNIKDVYDSPHNRKKKNVDELREELLNKLRDFYGKHFSSDTEF